jgi:rod shape-determining protein MreD
MKSYSSSAPTHEPHRDWRTLALTLAAAFVLKQFPWEGWALLIRPDFVLVMLLFWAQRWPESVGLGLAFLLGLLADVQDGVVLGQHALAYCIGVFLVQFFSRRLVMFTLPRQAMQMLPLLLLTEVVALAAGWLSARSPQDGWGFLSAAVGALLWWVVAAAGKMPAARPGAR